MVDEREGRVERNELERAFNRQNVWKRFLIVVAGPTFNFLFAILVYAGLFMYGLPEARPVLAEPPPGTLAAAAGLHAGATVRAIDGEPVATWQDVRWRVLQLALQREAVHLETEDERGRVTAATLDLRDFSTDAVETDVLEQVGLRLYRPPLEPVLGMLVAGGPGARPGLRGGERMVRAEGQPVDSWEAVVKAVRARPGAPLRLAVERGDTAMTIEVVPDAVAAGEGRIGRIGA